MFQKFIQIERKKVGRFDDYEHRKESHHESYFQESLLESKEDILNLSKTDIIGINFISFL